MAFDGCYPRRVREGGVVHKIFVHRAYCRACNRGEALIPDFLLARRLDSTATIGAAVLQNAGAALPENATGLYAEVPSRTLRSWRQRFAERADELAASLSAFCVARGGRLPRSAPTALARASEAIGAVWCDAGRSHRLSCSPTSYSAVSCSRAAWIFRILTGPSSSEVLEPPEQLLRSHEVTIPVQASWSQRD